MSALVVVSDACQINDFDHAQELQVGHIVVSDACQINDFDHMTVVMWSRRSVSDACQINDFDHLSTTPTSVTLSFRCLSDQ